MNLSDFGILYEEKKYEAPKFRLANIKYFLKIKFSKNNLSAIEIFKPLITRLNDINQLNYNGYSEKELCNLKHQINFYSKHIKLEDKINVSETLISQIDKILFDLDDAQYNPNSNPVSKKQKRANIQAQKVDKAIFTHVSVFSELSDYKNWLNRIIDDSNSVLFVKGKSENSISQFQLNINVQQFAALFYFLEKEKILFIPDGKKREFAKSITSIFHTKGQKNVSIDSFINKFSKPEIETADYWAIEFTNLKIAAKKID